MNIVKNMYDSINKNLAADLKNLVLSSNKFSMLLAFHRYVLLQN